MKKITIVLLLFSQLSIFAQNYKFGKVSKEELEEKMHPLDSTANAAYLYKSKEVFIEYSASEGWLLVTLVHERIKIYKKEAANYASEEIRLFKRGGTDEIINGLKAYTYNLEGKKIKKDKLQKNQIFENEVSKNWFSKKFTMPKIKDGSIVEYKYRKTSPYFQYVDKIELQHSIPIKKLTVLVKIPEYYVYKTHSKGYLQMYFNESVKNKKINFTYRSNGGNVGTKTTKYEKSIDLKYKYYEMDKKNIPAIDIREPYISSINQYKSSVSFELSSILIPESRPQYFANSWEGVAKRIYKTSSFGEELKKSSYYRNDLEGIISGKTSESEKMIAIFQFVKNKMKWNGIEGKYTRDGVRKAYKEEVGNVSEINLILTSMLRFAGLNANPVLVSTRDNGVPIFPTITGFNYVISMVDFEDGSYVLLDASEIYSLPNILPTRALNWNGRKITKNGTSSWVKLTPNIHAFEENNMMVNISKNLIAEGFIRTKFDNSKALNFRKNYNHIKEESLKSLLEEERNIEIVDFKILNKYKIGKPVLRNVKFNIEDLIEQISGKIYIEPLLFLTENTNPFKLEDRKFPVNFTAPWKDKNTVSIQIPEGYKVETLPAPLAIGLPDNIGVFRYQVKQVGNKISTTSILQFNSAIITPEYYEALKGFYGELVKKQSEKIVLVKM
ncbi:MAG: transglutaminase domain-containing protein [Polaribacter sp.]|uniref:transglutaminase domain-containing protein n=1 Tax=Polaribacter sp. TaxID=1920175 RepID=UPI002F358DF2